MTKVKNYSGIDIGKQSFSVCIEINHIYKTQDFAYTDQGMDKALKFLPKDTHCILESTGTYHCRLAYYLSKKGVCLSVVNPLSVKRFSQALLLRTKTDKSDSRMLISYGKSFSPKIWQAPADHYIELHQLINYQQQLIKEKVGIKNQMESIVHSQVQNKFVKESLLLRLKDISLVLEAVEEELEELIDLHNQEDYNHLLGIPGMGKKTAIVLMTLTGSMESFESAKQVCCYVGLCPRIYESGSSVKGKSRICKMGLGVIRKLLYMCALSARKYNKACRELYERLLSKGKSKKLILIAVANKLLKQAFAIIKNKTTYQDDFYQQKFAL